MVSPQLDDRQPGATGGVCRRSVPSIRPRRVHANADALTASGPSGPLVPSGHCPDGYRLHAEAKRCRCGRRVGNPLSCR